MTDDLINQLIRQVASLQRQVDGLIKPEVVVGGSAQPLDADLTAIAALSGTGFPARTAANTWALRTLAGGTDITVTNPAGIAGNPSIAFSGGIFSTWTLTITQGVNVTHTPTFVRSVQIGELVIATARTTVTSSGTGGSAILITGMPARVSAHETSTSAVGVGVVRVVTALTYHECTVIYGATGLAFVDGSSNNFLGANPNVQLVSGWTIGFTIAYEAA